MGHNGVMDQKNVITWLPQTLMLIGGIGVAMLVMHDNAGADLTLRGPIPGNQVAGDNQVAEEQPARSQWLQFEGVPSELDGSWPRFRGAQFDAISHERIELLRQWPEQGPERLWSIDLGQGYAGAAVHNGRVFVVDYDQEQKGDAIRCFSLDDGREIWRYFYPVRIKRQHGMSRTVPTVTDEALVCLGPKCHLTCVDPNTGALRWQIDLVQDFGAKVPPWYAGQCPIVEDHRAILAVGGNDVLIMAVDLDNGSILWKTPNPDHWTMTHSSLMPMRVADRDMYVYCAGKGVVGIDASDGTVLWTYPDWFINIANVPSPVPLADGRVFLSGGYNAGAIMLRIRQQAHGHFVAEPDYRLTSGVFGAEQHTPILYEGDLYGVRPDRQLVCLDPDGQVLWTSTKTFGIGPFMIAGGLIYVLDDDGLLTLAEATPDGYHELAEARILEGPDAWGPMAMADGRLILRDLNRMVCLNVRQ